MAQLDTSYSNYTMPVGDPGPIAPRGRWQIVRSKHFIGAVATALIIGVGAFWWQNRGIVNTDQLFNEMLASSLSLKSHHVEVTVGDAYDPSYQLSVSGDVQDENGQVAVRSTINANLFNTNIVMESVETPSNRYAKLAEYPEPQAPAVINTDVVRQWKKLTEAEPAADPNGDVFTAYITNLRSKTGEIPMGDFSEQDRKEILKLIKERKVYEKYAEPARIRYKGRDAFEYDMRVDIANLQALNEEVAKRSNENYEAVQQLFNYRENTFLRLIVDLESKALLKMEILDNDGVSTVYTYSRHNELNGFTEPQTDSVATNLNDLLSKAVRQ